MKCYSMLGSVVYFDQRTHARACICIVKNNQKHSKTTKSTFFIIRTSGLCNANEEKRRKKMIFECFQSFLTMRMHAFAGQNTQHRKHYTPKIINAFTITLIACFWPKQKKSIQQSAAFNYSKCKLQRKVFFPKIKFIPTQIFVEILWYKLHLLQQI